MTTTKLLIGTCLLGMAIAAWSATQCTIRNRNSTALTAEVRSGNNNDCNANPVTTTRDINANSSIVVPYGGAVTHVCARERIGNGWGPWHSTSCPGSDNSLCYINLN